ncbi:hypothetical protein TIFTF001_034374 [Ficus carica]|uniref:Uncharacterized protein n=1 Tax=Ficus carica TaxID=3494 RepID=A0AA88E0B6_FICCA|nr:hypothetical protein TIFTF001_034374 [Ficus carica]
MPKISSTTPNVIARTGVYLHDCSVAVHLQKEKHLEVIGTLASSADSGARATQSGRLPSVPDGQIGLRRTVAIGPIDWCHVSLIRHGGHQVTDFMSNGRWSGCCVRQPSLVTPDEVVNTGRVTWFLGKSLGRIKLGQQYPIRADGYFNLHITGLLSGIRFCDWSGLRHQCDRALRLVGRSRSLFGRSSPMRDHPDHYGLVEFSRMFSHSIDTCHCCHVSRRDWWEKSVESCQELLIETTSLLNPRRTEKVKFSKFFSMSDFSDSKNTQLSGDIDVTGSSSSIPSSSSNTTGGATAPGAPTPDNLSGISDIPSPGRPAIPTSRVREGAARLEEILQVGPTTLLDRRFIEELNEADQAQPAPVVDLTDSGDEASERTASPASTSGREGSESLRSTPPAGEPIQAR